MFKIAMLLVVAGLAGCTRDVVTVVDAKAGTFLRRDKVLGGLYWCEKTHCELVTAERDQLSIKLDLIENDFKGRVLTH